MNSILVIVLVVVLPNLWATVHVARSEQAQRRKAIFIFAIWIIPIMGAVAAVVLKPPKAAPQGPETPAPASIEHAGSERFALHEHLMNGNGLPILDWDALDQWAEGNAEAIELGRRAWLLHFRDAMGPPAHLRESADAWVLSSYEPRIATAAATYVASTRKRIVKLLDGLADFPAGARSILVVLDNLDDYYRYVANYYPDGGEFAFSGGMYINHGCPHFVTVIAELSLLEPVIAHEMTHSALAHLHLPLWLDEGIAVTTEHQVSVSYRHPRDAVEMIGRHLEFWNAERMQEFWSGSSFARTDDGNALSYDLARSIVGLLGREWPTFVRFVSSAARDDAGAAAARNSLQLDLGDLAAAALSVDRQKGWSPNPAVWENEKAGTLT